MTKTDYPNVYKEVLVVLNNLTEEDYNKIPEKYIEFLKENCNNDYEFNYDTSKSIEQQNLSNNTKYILFGLFEKFGATEIQKEKIKLFKNNYYKKIEEQQRKKYNPDNIFRKKENIENKIENTQENLPVILKKDNIFIKMFKKLKNYLRERYR